MASPRRTRRRTALSRQRILRAALTLADQGGIESLTMRKLGERLGVEAMSLYNHVGNKEDLLDAITDLVAAKFQLPSQLAPWRVAMRQRALAARAVLLRHPWACRLIVTRSSLDPALAKYVDATIGTLRKGGFTLEQANVAWQAMDSYIHGFVARELGEPRQQRELPAGVLADELPHLRELLLHDAATDREREFELGLQLLLDGLERARGAESPG